MAVLPHSVSVGSVVAHTHAHTALSSASKTAVLFVLHGHPSRARHMKPIVYGTFDLLVKKANIAPEPPKRNFVIVTFVSRLRVASEHRCDAEDNISLGPRRTGRRR